MVILPTVTDQQNYSFEVLLDTTVYLLEFNWNTRVEKWFMSMSTATGTKILQGQKLVAGEWFGAWLSVDDAPSGMLYVHDSSRSDVDPGLDELAENSRCQLVYLSSDEAALLISDPDAFELEVSP